MAEFKEIKRQTAYKCDIATLLAGVFVKKEGWESNYLMTAYGDFSRVNIIAAVVGKDEQGILLDDGTGRISARSFEDKAVLQQVMPGAIVMCIGRPREYNGQVYLVIELIKQINNPGWIAYRRKELTLIQKVRDMQTIQKPTQIVDTQSAPSETTLSAKEKVLKIVQDIDDGTGASIDDVIKLSKVRNAEDLIMDMLLKGEVFEIKAGRIKIL